MHVKVGDWQRETQHKQIKVSEDANWSNPELARKIHCIFVFCGFICNWVKGSRAKTEVAEEEVLVEWVWVAGVRDLNFGWEITSADFHGSLGREENQLSFPSLQLSVDWTFGNQWSTPILSHEAWRCNQRLVANTRLLHILVDCF